MKIYKVELGGVVVGVDECFPLISLKQFLI